MGWPVEKRPKLTKNCNIQIEKLHKQVQRISPKNHSQTHTKGKRTKQLFPRRVPGCFLLLRLTRRAATPLARFRPIGRAVRTRGSALIHGRIRRRPGLGGHFFSHCKWSSTFFDRSPGDTVSNQRIQPGKETRPMHVFYAWYRLKQGKKEKQNLPQINAMTVKNTTGKRENNFCSKNQNKLTFSRRTRENLWVDSVRLSSNLRLATLFRTMVFPSHTVRKSLCLIQLIRLIVRLIDLLIDCKSHGCSSELDRLIDWLVNGSIHCTSVCNNFSFFSCKIFYPRSTTDIHDGTKIKSG